MPDSVFVVSQYDSGSEQSWVIGVFSSEEKMMKITDKVPRRQVEEFKIDVLGDFIQR